MLLDCLNIGMDDVDVPGIWLRRIRDAIRSSEGRRSLPRRYLELMVDLAVSLGRRNDPFSELQIADTLEEEEEWDVLEYWMGLTWAIQHPMVNGISEDLERVVLSLFRQRPNAVQKLEQWLQRSDHLSECVECLQ